MVLLVVFFYTYPFSQMHPPQSLCACALSQVWLVGACTGGFHLDKDNIILSCDSESHDIQRRQPRIHSTEPTPPAAVSSASFWTRDLSTASPTKREEKSPFFPQKSRWQPGHQQQAKNSKGYPNQWYLKWPGYPPNNDKLCIVNYD